MLFLLLAIIMASAFLVLLKNYNLNIKPVNVSKTLANEQWLEDIDYLDCRYFGED